MDKDRVKKTNREAIKEINQAIHNIESKYYVTGKLSKDSPIKLDVDSESFSFDSKALPSAATMAKGPQSLGMMRWWIYLGWRWLTWQ